VGEPSRSPAAILAGLAANFVVGLAHDLSGLAAEFGYQHRLMTCMATRTGDPQGGEKELAVADGFLT
jgi:hypothetical protein